MPIEKDQLVVVGLMVILGVAFGFGVWAPARAQRDQLNQKLNTLKGQKDNLDHATQGLDAWRERVDLLNDKLRGAQQYVPRHNEQGQVIRGLTKALGEYGVNKQEMVIRSTIHGSEFSVIPIVLQYQSSFPSVYNSLRRIEQMPRLIRVEKLSVRSDPQRPAEPAEIYLKLDTFFSQGEGPSPINQSNGGRS